MKKSLLIVACSFLFFQCQKSVSTEDFKKTKDSLEFFRQAYQAANYFSIEDNMNARAQFGDIDVDVAMAKVQNDLRLLEKEDGGNPLLPLTLEGEKTYMNKAAVLNHKWIIMDYYKKNSEGEMLEVGELLIEYTFHEELPCDFFVLSRVTY